MKEIIAGIFYLPFRWLFFSDSVRLSDKKKHTINKKLREKKLFIYVVFTYRKGMIIFFFSLQILVPGVYRRLSTAKKYSKNNQA